MAVGGTNKIPSKGLVFLFAQAAIFTIAFLLNALRDQPPMLLVLDYEAVTIPENAVLMVSETVVLRARVRNINDGNPVVLVKPLDVGQPWYVQDVAVVDGSTFESLVHFGDRRTAKGTQFLLAVVAVPETKSADAPRPGDAIHDLSTLPELTEVPELPSTTQPLLLARR